MTFAIFQAIYKKYNIVKMTESTLIKESDLKTLIHKEVEKREKKLTLESEKKKIVDALKNINEGSEIATAPNAGTVTPVAGAGQTAPAQKAEKSESIFDSKPGETVIFNFQDVTIKLQRQLDDLFKVTDAAESKKLKDGDYVQIKGNDTLSTGKAFKFKILRPALDYQSNPIQSWRIIKN